MEHSHYISTEVLTLETLQEIIAEHKTLALSEEAKINIQQCRDYLDQKMAANKTPIYGINTGFGSLCNVKISNENLSQLQENLALAIKLCQKRPLWRLSVQTHKMIGIR